MFSGIEVAVGEVAAEEVAVGEGAVCFFPNLNISTIIGTKSIPFEVKE